MFIEFETLLMKHLEQYADDQIPIVTQVSSDTIEAQREELFPSALSKSLLDMGDELLLLAFGQTLIDTQTSMPKKIQRSVYEVFQR